MSATDMVVLQFLSSFGLPLLSILCILLVTISRFQSMRVTIISKLLAWFEAKYAHLTHQYCEDLFSPLHSMRSADWKLRNRGLLRILEINVRTGENFKFYPKNAHLLVVDRNVYVRKYLSSDTGLARLDHLNLTDVRVGFPEKLQHIPSGSIDAVVATRVLCSAVSVNQVLSEIHRVLSPGGKYFFLEHIHEKHPYSPLRLLQSALTMSKVWPLIANNCHLNRNVEIFIRCMPGFKCIFIDRLQLRSRSLPLLRIMPSHIIGVATKSF